MKKEDKELLLKDLSARLPYGVTLSVGIFDNGDIKYHNKKLDYHSNLLSLIELDGGYYFNGLFCKYPQFSARPYLRSKEDMTDEEKREYAKLQDFANEYHYEFGDLVDDIVLFDNDSSLDYLNSIHVDYRGLIDKDLAIMVTPDNNPYE